MLGHYLLDVSVAFCTVPPAIPAIVCFSGPREKVMIVSYESSPNHTKSNSDIVVAPNSLMSSTAWTVFEANENSTVI